MSTIVLEHLQHANSSSPDLTIDSAGNISLGASTIKSPNTIVNQIQLGNSSNAPLFLTSEEGSGNRIALSASAYKSGTNWNTGWNYANSTEAATQIGIFDQAIVFRSAGSGTEDSAITWSESMRVVGGTGRVGIGTTSPSSPLEVNSSVDSAYSASSYNSVPIITLKSPNTVDNYTGIRYSNSAGNYEWYAGAHQTGVQDADFVIQGFDRTNNGYKEHIRVYDTGQVSMPYTPSFSATGFSAHRYMNTWHNVDLNNWNFVDQSSANAYDNSTGRFTAPVAGMYFFIYTCMFQNPSTNDFHNLLKKNGNGVVYSNNHAGGGSTNGHTWNDTTVNQAMYLQAGDYVTCASTGNSSSTCFLYGSSPSTRYSNFSGWFIG